MAEYPPYDGPPPNPFPDGTLAAVEEALRRLSYGNELLKRCERCNIPVSEMRKDCDGMCAFFNSVLDEIKGQQAPIPTPVG